MNCVTNLRALLSIRLHLWFKKHVRRRTTQREKAARQKIEAIHLQLQLS